MRDLLLKYYNGQPATPFTPPPGVVRTQACFASPTRMCVNDYFLADSLRALALAPTAAPAPPISQPTQREAPQPEPQRRNNDDEEPERNNGNGRGRNNND
jgi:hypothetical protein